ncbi:aminotransferase [Chelatococcus sp. SYSU_G07232]|uniref:aspartate transaminase n=1 Tax=Chelatococcus albus TaxID=3047466 RepID=A0ABT7AGF3_9HYPH|nr:aminotransferase [Chelatococcus sp. SYSU_G07232]MDJ1157721.1 aminotransferase [Chelatococcus sp. SYSU_G07232]
MPGINPLLVDTCSPPIPEAQGWARRYAGAHGPFVDLSQAVPGYPPHEGILARLAEAAGSPRYAGYGAILGDLALREAYAEHLGELYGGALRAAEVAITAGCNQAFFVTMLALAGAGDAVMLPTPWYFNHKMTLDMLGIEARPLPCAAESGFVPDPDIAEGLVDERVKAIVLVTPNDPTGAVYSPEVIARFQALCRKRGRWLVIDETYRDFLASGVEPAHRLFADPHWGDSLIELYSFSKAYCVPGHRLGAITAAAPVIEEIAKVMDCVQICAARPGQAALAWAVPALRDWRAHNRAEIGRRVAAFRAALAPVPGWRIDSIGAYFAYLRHPFPDATAREVAERLVVERGVLALPGSYFGEGQDGHLRVAFANVDAVAIGTLAARLDGFAP